MTIGSPSRHILLFALPLLAGSFLQQLYNLVDSWVVGNYVGDSALAAVGVGFPVIFMFSSLFMGLSTGGTVVIAQFYGASCHEKVQETIDTIYTTLMSSAIPLILLGILLVKPLLWILRVDVSAAHDAQIYLTVICAGMLGSIGYNINAGILNGLGNSRTTLFFLMISTCMNIVLDLFFVLALSWGVFGVAFATILSQLISWLFGLWYINRNYPEISIHPFHFSFSSKLFRQIMGIGLPAGLQMSLIALGSMAVISKVNSFGKEFTAAYNVGYRMEQMAFLPIQSLGSAITAFVGQNFGAKKLNRVRQGIRAALFYAVSWAALALLLIPLGPTLVSFFSDTPTVIAAGTDYLRCVMPFYIPFAVMFTLNNSIRGAGDSVFPMLVALLSLIFLRVPMVYYLADHFGPDYMYYGIGIGWLAGCIIATVYYCSGHWKKHRSVVDENPAETL